MSFIVTLVIFLVVLGYMGSKSKSGEPDGLGFVFLILMMSLFFFMCLFGSYGFVAFDIFWVGLVLETFRSSR